MKKILDSKILQKYWQKIYRHPIFAKTMIITGVVLVALALIIFIFNVAYGQKIFPKTYIGGLNLGGQTQTEAEVTLQKAMIANKDKKVVLSFKEQTFPIASADIELAYNPQKSAQIAWDTGREGKIQKILVEQFRAIFGKNAYPAAFDYSKDKLTANLGEIAQTINVSEKDAAIVIDGLIPKIEPEQTGQQVDLTANTQLVLDFFGEISPLSQGNLIVATIDPKITQENIKATFEQVKLLLENEIVFKTEKKDFTLEPKVFAEWLEFAADNDKRTLVTKVNQNKVNQYVNDLASQIFEVSRDAKFEMSGGRAKAFQTSRTGYELDKEQAIKLVSDAILKPETALELPVKVTEPDVSSSSATAAGISELVGEGQTSWRGSPKNRIHNLTLGSKNISGTVVKSGEEFSTIKAIGPIDAAHGFLPELVIKNGTQVVPDIGGGLCQVSTTLFRAALNAGLKITARTNHSFRVSYYEPPVGMDATIYDPAPDLKFINNMNTPILIWATPTDNGLSFQIFGRKDGRKVEISDPVKFNYVSPPDPIYTETDTMEPGAIRQVERATSGVTASFHYKVTDSSGNTLQNQTFVSKYIPIPDTFLYGPGAAVPTPPPAPSE